MIKRIWNFDKRDVKHVTWLFKNMIKAFFKGDYIDMVDAYYFIKIHCSYDSKKNKIGSD